MKLPDMGQKSSIASPASGNESYPQFLSVQLRLRFRKFCLSYLTAWSALFSKKIVKFCAQKESFPFLKKNHAQHLSLDLIFSCFDLSLSVPQCLNASDQRKFQTFLCLSDKFEWVSTPSSWRGGISEWRTEKPSQGSRLSAKCDKGRVQVYVGKISKFRLLSRITDGSWVDGRKVHTLGWTRIGRQVQHGYQKRTPKIREQLEVVCQRLGLVSPMDNRDDNQEAVKTIKVLRQQADQPSNPPILPSYQTRRRPIEERQKAEWQQWNWPPWSNSPSSSSSATHPLGGHHKSGRNAIYYFSISFAYKKWRFPCKRRVL